jgi:hypothetical protein
MFNEALSNLTNGVSDIPEVFVIRKIKDLKENHEAEVTASL